MKKWILALFLCPFILKAQKEFPAVWESKFSVDARWNAVNPDLSLVLGGDLKEIEMLDGTTGKALWKLVMKDQYGVKSCEDWIYLTDENVVEVKIQKSKNDPTISYYLDDRTGKVVDETAVAARAKEKRSRTKVTTKTDKYVFQNSCEDEASNTYVTIGYDDKLFKNAMGGRMMNMTVTASGGNNWTSSFEGRIVAHLCANLVGEDLVLNVFTAQGKVFVVHEGITVLDLKSGKVLWTTTFDYTDTDIGMKARQEIGRTAWPAVASDGVYICDLTKSEKSIKKLDLNTGSVIWTGAKLSKNDIISNISVEGGNLIVKYGGLIMKETYFAGSENVPETWKVFYEYEGSTSIQAYDLSNGSLKWSTEKWDNGDNFKKAPCNIIADEGKVLFCSDKFFYSVDAATGNIDFKTDYGAKTIGTAQSLYSFDGQYMIEGEKGIGALTPDGKQIYAVDTDKCLATELQGDAFIVWTGKDLDDQKEFIRIDHKTGKIYGKLEGCYHPRWDTTGDYFVRFDGSKVLKYKTN